MEQWEASEKLAQETERILEAEYSGDRSKYAEAFSLAGKRNRGAVDAYSVDYLNSPWAPDDADTPAAPPTQGRAMDALTAKVLAEKFDGDTSHYAEAMLEASRRRPDLFANYQGQGLERDPDTTGAPAYTRLMPADLQAKSRLDAPASAYPGQATIGGVSDPKAYDPRGLQEQKLLLDVVVIQLRKGLVNGQFQTAADVVAFLSDATPQAIATWSGERVQVGPTNATAISGARMVPAK